MIKQHVENNNDKYKIVSHSHTSGPIKKIRDRLSAHSCRSFPAFVGNFSFLNFLYHLKPFMESRCM